MQVGTIDVNKLRGVTDKGLGLGKEFLGVLVGNDRLQREGEAQQDRAAAELEALRDEAKAEKLDAKAKSLEVKQRAAQRTKSS
jgi:uncharacterized protein YjbJ (UPF0337 family)